MNSMDLDRIEETAEEVSHADLSRDRITFLMGQNSTMVTQTQFADAKAGAMLAFTGLIATRGPGAVVGAEEVTLGVLVLLSLHMGAMLCCLIALYPRYAVLDVRRRLAARERFSWPALTSDDLDADAFVDFMRGAHMSQLVVSIARSNHMLAQILHSKFAWLRGAFAFAMADISFMVLRFIFGH